MALRSESVKLGNQPVFLGGYVLAPSREPLPRWRDRQFPSDAVQPLADVSDGGNRFGLDLGLVVNPGAHSETAFPVMASHASVRLPADVGWILGSIAFTHPNGNNVRMWIFTMS
jgi:hypothetical protein